MSHLDSMIARTIGNNARDTFNDIIGTSEQFFRCIQNAIKISGSSSSILLLGESGTGKDLFAQSIHNASKRSNQPYFAINCAAIPHELIESELFGYVESQIIKDYINKYSNVRKAAKELGISKSTLYRKLN